MNAPLKDIFANAFLRTLPHKRAEIYTNEFTKELTRTLAEQDSKRRRVITMPRASFNYEPGPSRHHGRAGTWTAYMARTVLAHTNSRSAAQAHADSGQYSEKRLDFNWMLANQYITKV